MASPGACERTGIYARGAHAARHVADMEASRDSRRTRADADKESRRVAVLASAAAAGGPRSTASATAAATAHEDNGCTKRKLAE